MKTTIKLLAAVVGCLSFAAANAVPTTNFNFYKLDTNGATTDFRPTSGTFYDGSHGCSSGDLCSSKVIGASGTTLGGSLIYTLDGITATATATSKPSRGDRVAATVVQDSVGTWTTVNGHAGSGAGLGVYHKFNDTSDDNVQSDDREWLTITFNKAVTIKGIGLQNEGHINFTTDNKFKLAVDGFSNDLTFKAGAFNAYDFTGTSFTFSTGCLTGSNQFYLSELDVVAAVPEPETYALMLAGLGVVGFMAKRRKAK